jgi:hypothetical protein
MRLVDFLVLLLETQAETLRRLAAFFGEEEFFEILEASGDEEEPTPSDRAGKPQILDLQLEKPLQGSSENVYQALEGAVQELNLPAILEFHLWAYPHYRAFIESPLDLNSRIPGPGGNTGTVLVEEAVEQAQAWIRKLHIPSHLGPQAERAAFVPWLRFRATALKRIGRRPLGPVY